jgi:hypothetical protein
MTPTTAVVPSVELSTLRSASRAEGAPLRVATPTDGTTAPHTINLGGQF